MSQPAAVTPPGRARRTLDALARPASDYQAFALMVGVFLFISRASTANAPSLVVGLGAAFVVASAFVLTFTPIQRIRRAFVRDLLSAVVVGAVGIATAEVILVVWT